MRVGEEQDCFSPTLKGGQVEVFLLINILSTNSVQKWYCEKGTGGPVGRILVADTDRDSRIELIFGYAESLHIKSVIYELYPDNYFHLEAIIDTMTSMTWATGDFDLDGFYDVVLSGSFGIPFMGPQIYESPDSFSYPIREVWRDTVGQTAVVPTQAYDVDKDGIPEIFDKNGSGQPHWIWVYESYGNNQYDTVCTFNPITNGSPQSSISTNAFGDFDGDGKIEFVMGDLDEVPYGADFWVFECPANNTYEQIYTGYLPTVNIKDCFSVPDADRDGKWEFVVKGFRILSGLIDVFILESTGDNTYEVIKSFTLPGGDYNGGYSDAGDIDGDSVPEIVLEARQNVFVIKASGNNNFYILDTLPGNGSGSNVLVTNDFDHNGFNEIIISGNIYTRIYEKTPFVTWFCPVPNDTFYANDTVYPKWKLDETIGIDTLKLYWAHYFGYGQLIYQGLPTDTICQWIVPDLPSNFFYRLWLVVKGISRYDSTPSPVFYIKRRTGIEERIPHSAFQIPHLKVYPNPFSEKIEIRYTIQDTGYTIPDINLKIYDVTGRMVRDLSRLTVNGQRSTILWFGEDDSGHKLPSGVYIIRLEKGEEHILKKVVKLR
uniref:T9SS type A sorting domain-containing protein n=1 Tax=candidate division WOR-3 bacterium TaxID=2052148 RepID=A0A7V1EGZ4_UNCW3